jgi:hypothetical protein
MSPKFSSNLVKQLKRSPKVKKLPKYYLKIVVDGNNHCHEHVNHMVFRIVCCLYCVFYVLHS